MAPRGSSQRGGGRGGTTTSRREADLSGVLTSIQKNELTLLATSITEGMLHQVSNIFNSSVEPLLFHVSTNIVTTGTFDETDQKTMNNTSCSTLNNGRNCEARGMQSELKREALAALRRWQALVLKRFSEISVSKDTLRNEAQSPTKPQHIQSRRLPEKYKFGYRDSRGIIAENNHSIAIVNKSASPSVAISQLPIEKRELLLHTLILLILSLEAYTAYSRAFILRMASHLRLPVRIVVGDETRIAQVLSSAVQGICDETGFLKAEETKKGRRGGGSGRAASDTDSITQLNGRIGYTAEGTNAASTLGSLGTLSDGGLAACTFFGLCGSRGSAPKSFYTFTRDIQDISLIPMHGEKKGIPSQGKAVPPCDQRLRVTIGISGWASYKNNVSCPWSVLGDNTESYALRWEDETLLKIGTSLETMAMSLAWQNAKKEFANRNVFISLNGFAWPDGMLKISKIVDNPWSIGMVRADKVGQALADSIANKVQGERGVSLLGYGLGARAIYTCLMSLSERRVFGLVENVVLMGTPAPSTTGVWTALRSAVFGRVINVFSENDCMLGFLHRTGCIQFGVAGLQRIQGVYGIENVDASKPVSNHLRYANLVGNILRDVGWDDLDTAQISNSEQDFSVAGKVREQDIEMQTGQLTSKINCKVNKETSSAKSGKKEVGNGHPTRG